MSSLRSQCPLEYPQMHSPSLPLCPVGIPYLRKRNRSPWFFSAQASCSQKDAAWLPRLGLNPSTNLPLQPYFQLLPQSATPASIPIFFQLFWAAVVSLGRHGPVAWSKSSLSFYAGSVTRGRCPLVTSWVEVTLISLAQSTTTAI